MRKNLLLWLSIAALAAALGAVCWLLREDPFTPQRRLSDGSTLYLDAVTHGPWHETVTGRGWARRLAPVLPPDLQARLGVQPYGTIAVNAPGVCFWVRRGGPGSLNLDHVRAEAFDELGNRAFRYEHARLAYDPVDWSVPFLFPVWPRRGKRVGLRLYYRENMRWQPLTEFIVDNPARVAATPAAAAASPTVVNAGDLRVVVERCVVRDVRRDPASGVSDGARLLADFRVTDAQGRPSPWRPVELSATDAGGNHYFDSAFPTGKSEVTGFRAMMNGILLPPEPLKLRLLLGRQPDSSPVPAGRWHTSGIPMPALNRHTAVERRGKVGGGTIRFLGLNQFHQWKGWSYVEVRTEFSGPPNRLLGLVSVRDDRGRTYSPPTRILRMRRGEENFVVRVRPDARRIWLAFTVQRSRTVELTVQPQYVVESPQESLPGQR